MMLIPYHALIHPGAAVRGVREGIRDCPGKVVGYRAFRDPGAVEDHGGFCLSEGFCMGKK